MIGSSKEYFDNLGADWERLRVGFFSEDVRERALDAAAVRPGTTAVDVGAGTGFVTRGLIARGVRVIAVDQSSRMLEALGARLGPGDSVEWRTGEADRLPVADAAVDYCFANMLLHHVESPRAAIREMARVVRPGGRVVVTDLDAHDHEFLRTEHHDRWMGFRRDELRDWFEGAGLTAVRIADLNEACRATSSCGRSAAVGIFLALGTVPTPSRERGYSTGL